MIVRQADARLPIWPDAVRGGPNALLRSAFFAGIHSKKRRVLGIQTGPDVEPEGVVIAAQDGVTVKYAGTQLNQYDADVFFEVMHRSRRERLGVEAVFAGYSFLQAIGRDDSRSSYQDLDNSLRRLKRGTIDVQWTAGHRPYIYVGSLIADYTRETETKAYHITLSPKILTLFAPSSWTQIEWDERMKLRGKPLALWLHSYFSTHARPFPVSIAFLKEKTGSLTTLLKHFRVELRSALQAIQEAIGWAVQWDGDLITVTRPPSGAQGRLLLRTEQRDKMLDAGSKAVRSSRARLERRVERASHKPSRNQQHDASDLTRAESIFKALFQQAEIEH